MTDIDENDLQLFKLYERAWMLDAKLKEGQQMRLEVEREIIQRLQEKNMSHNETKIDLPKPE